jgi:hypothetical protein
MKRLFLVASLSMAAFVVAPLASASAAENTLTGSCTVEGAATFKPGLSKLLTKTTYEFDGTAKCVTVTGELTGKAHVTGEGELQCAVSHGGLTVLGSGGPGPGWLKLGTPEVEYPFELAFVAAGGNVALKVTNKEGTANATGDAEFLTPEPAEKPGVLAKCATGSLESLKFLAVTAGTV